MSGESQTQASKSPLPMSHINSSLNELWHHVWSLVYQGSSLEIWCPGFSLGAGHLGALCLTYNKIPNSQRENRCSDSLGIVSHFCHFLLFQYRELFTTQVSRCQQASLASNLSKHSSLNTAMLIIFCIPTSFKIFISYNKLVAQFCAYWREIK